MSNNFKANIYADLSEGCRWESKSSHNRHESTMSASVETIETGFHVDDPEKELLRFIGPDGVTVMVLTMMPSGMDSIFAAIEKHKVARK